MTGLKESLLKNETINQSLTDLPSLRDARRGKKFHSQTAEKMAPP